MATMNQAQIGSATWVAEERKRVNDLLEERVEDFYCTFAEKPMDWLNAHMDGIFSGTHIDVAEVFKTPGKLRGRTPRAARSVRAAQPREPLGDIFTSNIRSPAHDTQFYQRVAQIHVAEDKENGKPLHYFKNSPLKESGNVEKNLQLRKDTPQNRRSSRHVPTPQRTAKGLSFNQDEYSAPSQPIAPYMDNSLDTVHRVTDESYVTAHETRSIRPEKAPIEIATDTDEAGRLGSEHINEGLSPSTPITLGMNVQKEDELHIMLGDTTRGSLVLDSNTVPVLNEEKDTSEKSSPERPLVRESSLAFACLPAREPLTNLKGAECITSWTSQLELSKGSNSRTIERVAENAEDCTESVAASDEPAKGVEAAQRDAKTSTQRLQERLALLGKTSISRTSKSIPNSAMQGLHVASEAVPQSAGQSTWSSTTVPAAPSIEDNDEDWIGPIDSQTGKAEMQTIRNSVIQQVPDSKPTIVMAHEKMFTNPPKGVESNPRPQPSTLHHIKSFAAVSYPNVQQYDTQSTTPTGSPAAKKPTDGPLSASKAKFYSVLQSAKGIFASSAGTSAMAKMNILPQVTPAAPAPNHPENDREHQTKAKTSQHQALGMASNRKATTDSAQSHSNLQTAVETNRSRRSSGRIASLKENKAEGFIDNSQKTFDQQHSEAESLKDGEPPGKEEISQGHQQRSHEARRPVKVGKDAASRVKPAPVSVKVASQRIGQIVPSNAVLAASLQESLPPTLTNKPAIITKKASNSSLHTTLSNQNLKASAAPASARPKALEAAARKRELDEREAQRKAEQRKEIERRRAAKQEDERRQAQEQKSNDQRALDSRNALQRSVMEQRKPEVLRKHDEQRPNALASHNKMSNDRQTLSVKPTRLESNAAKPLTRPPIPHINPAKPPKRTNVTEGDDERAAAVAGAHPAKRRRTSENSYIEPPARPTMAPPIRLSAMRKEAATKPVPGHAKQSFHGGSTFNRSTNLAPHHGQHPKTPHANDMSKSLNSRSAFKDAPNPPGTALHSHGHQPNKLPGPKSIIGSAIKSSPQYPNGDSIELPEIQTESEDSDDDRGDFVPPAWADSPALRDLLRRQQLVDPRDVFGPIAPLMMEEVFKGSKGVARFRPRSSSANWNGPDRLTEEERKRDYEAREQIEKEQGWTYRAGV